MTDLGSMFQNLGPAGASVLAGMQQANAYNEQRSQEAYRQAQMEEIRQRTAQQAAMNPLELEAKQTANKKAALEAALAEATQAGKIEGADLDVIAKRRQNIIDKTTTAATLLNNAVPLIASGAPGYQAYAEKAMRDAGIDPNDPADQAQWNSVMSQKTPQAMAKAAGALQQHIIRTSEKYISRMDEQRLQNEGSARVAEIGAKSREAAAAARNRGTQTIEDLVKSGKMTAEKAAVSLYGAAQFEQDPLEKQRLMSMAQTYEQFAMQQRQATQAGKPDVGQIANLPTTQLPPSMGGGPKLGTKENPIKLD